MFKGILKMKNKEDVHYFTLRPTKNHSDQDSVVLAKGLTDQQNRIEIPEINLYLSTQLLDFNKALRQSNEEMDLE